MLDSLRPLELAVCVLVFLILVFQFRLRDQGMGARRGFAAGTHGAGGQRARACGSSFSPIEKLTRISLRIETLDVPPQDIITRDNVSVKVNAVCYFRVVDANSRSRRCRIICTLHRSSRRPLCAAWSASSSSTRSFPSAKR